MSNANFSTTAIIPRPTPSPHIWQDLQDAVNAGVASQEFPIGTRVQYPFFDFGMGQTYMLEMVLAHQQDDLPTIYGPAPGIILQHLVAANRVVGFRRDGTRYLARHDNRYEGSKLEHYLTKNQVKHSFWSGLPEELRAVITPLSLTVPAHVFGNEQNLIHPPAGVDTVDEYFFPPSLEELGFNQDGKQQTAKWQFFRQNPRYVFRDYLGGAVSCWLRSVSWSDFNHAWAISAKGDAVPHSVDEDSLHCAPFCAIIKRPTSSNNS